jgi:hypothetical protein
MKNKENGGEGVCQMRIQAIDYDSFFWLHRILPHILPHIKIRVTVDVSQSNLDLIIGGGPQDAGAFLLTLKHFIVAFVLLRYKV